MRKFLVLSGLTLFLIGCSDSNTQEDIEDSETVNLDENTVESDNGIKEQEFLGEYAYTSDEQASNVKFEENGTLRFLDNSGNKRYSLREDSSRIVIDEEIYLIKENKNGYNLLSINENSERTNNDILLEKK